MRAAIWLMAVAAAGIGLGYSLRPVVAPAAEQVRDEAVAAQAPGQSPGTGGGKEHNLDAYTKLAGEGARWVCVRKHAASIQNNSLFYVAHASDKSKVTGVTFQTLWGNWKDAFGKRYDIPDADVVTAIKSGGLAGLAQDVEISKLTGKDYDLAAGKTHGT